MSVHGHSSHFSLPRLISVIAESTHKNVKIPKKKTIGIVRRMPEFSLDLDIKAQPQHMNINDTNTNTGIVKKLRLGL